MFEINIIICNSGDGSSHLRWVKDPAVLDRMFKLADDGDEIYASGDGLQVTITTIRFKTIASLKEFEETNKIDYTLLEDMDDKL